MKIIKKILIILLLLFSCILAYYSWFYYKSICAINVELKDSFVPTTFSFSHIDKAVDIPVKDTLNLFPKLTGKDRHYISKKIYANECGSLEKNLLFWNKKEDFPSLGIGHFIWYPEGVDPGFEETFPVVMGFIQQKGIAVPIWLINQPAPWKNRQEFFSEINTERMLKFRKFLKDTIDIQTDYIVARAQVSLIEILNSCDDKEKKQLTKKAQVLVNSYNGVYAIVDYVNFKGTGLSPKERYNDQGWGLKQVLQSMSDDITQENALSEFATACEKMLDLRVTNAKPLKNEGKWLEGWKKRVRIYAIPKNEERIYW